jgi:hypothetical protein
VPRPGLACCLLAAALFGEHRLATLFLTAAAFCLRSF